MKDFIKYFYEMGMLSRIRRTGPYAAGIKNSETVSQHVYRAAIIAYFLAKLEKANVEKAVLMTLFHDNIETRIGDLNKIAARYIQSQKAEKKVWKDQIKNFPEEIKDDLKKLYQELNDLRSKESIISKDADLLECAIQAKEYKEIGYKSMQDWINNVKKRLKTNSAKKMIKVVERMHPEKWWEGIKKIYLEGKDK